MAFYSFATIATLRAAQPPTFDTSGTYFCAESGQNYRWDPTSSASDNGGTTLRPNTHPFANGNGRYLANTSGEAADVLAALAVAASPVAINGQKLTNVGAPTAATDGATKGYVDGLSTKTGVLVASTGNVALTGEQTIDGVLTSASRVLLKDQTIASQNGIWVTAAGAWARPADFATGSHASGESVFVEQGTVNVGTGWICESAPGADVVDTNNLSFNQFTSSGFFGNVADFPSYANVDDSQMPDGALTWCVSRQVFVQLQKKTPLPGLNAFRILATKSGVGRWIRLVNTTSIYWNAVNTFYIDPNNTTTLASDDNDGLTNTTPLLTAGELALRIIRNGHEAAGGTVTINLLSSGSTAGTRASLQFLALGFGTVIVVNGSPPVQLFTGTLTSATAVNRGAGTGAATLIQASGLSDTWTNLGAINARIRTTSGTLGSAFVLKDDGGGSKQAEVTVFKDSTGANFTPAGTETFVVETLCHLNQIQFDWNDTGSSGTGTTTPEVQCTFNDVELDQNNANYLMNATMIFNNSKINSVAPRGAANLTLKGCLIAGILTGLDNSQTIIDGGGAIANVVAQRDSQAFVQVKNDTFFLNSELIGTNCKLRVGNACFKNTSAGKVAIDLSIAASVQSQGGELVTDGVIYGTIADAGTAVITLGKHARFDVGGQTHTAASTVKNVSFGSTTKNWSELPFVDQFNVGAGAVASANMASAL